MFILHLYFYQKSYTFQGIFECSKHFINIHDIIYIYTLMYKCNLLSVLKQNMMLIANWFI